jgi:hypothetical protein
MSTPPTPPDSDRWRNMDGKEAPPEGVECELLLPDGEVIPGAVFDPQRRNWQFDVPQHLRSRTLYISGWRPAKK